MLDLGHLNPEQRRAVETVRGPLLVLAGAGSGKTRVVVHRIANLLAHGVEPEAILAVTFTNKAAAEMRERVGALTQPEVAARLTVSTFHAFGLQVVRAHHRHVGLGRRFAIFDAQDQLALLRRLMQQVSLAGRDLDPKRILARISLLKNAGVTPEAFAGRARADDDYEVMVAELYPRYERALRAANAVDFDDLIVLPLRLLEENAAVREALQGRYRHFLVDEYQDTSRVQVRLLRALAARAESICAVGDDDQSIYAWRGAEVENILRFEQSFPGTTEVKLTQNYRSTGRILEAANAVIAKNPARRGKSLWTAGGAGEPIRVVVCPDGDAEAEWVTEEALRLVHEGRRRWDDVAILFRTNGQARPFEEALRRHHVPYRLVGGTRFFDRKEVRDGLAYLRILHNPHDDVALARIVNFPARGIGETTLERAFASAREQGGSLWSALRRIERLPGCERAAPSVLEFVDLVERYRARAAQASSLAGLAADLFEEVDLFEAVRASVKSREAGQVKVEILRGLVDSIAGFEARNPGAGLGQYLGMIALEGKEEAPEEKGKLHLLTLHAAKGLEFPIVFLVGVEEGFLPHSGMMGAEQDLPEERRLAYVGITRAKERLYLTRARERRSRGRVVPRVPSRFLEDLPPESYEEVDACEAESALSEAAYEAGVHFFEAMKARLRGESEG